ncbi:MAG: 30S ribosomal protein S2 [Terriglobia bacterium]
MTTAEVGSEVVNVTMKELLEAGVHFGHQTRRWNPKMKEYIFGERNGIYIIDLQKTLKMFKGATQFVAELGAAGKTLLFVGTKRQAQEAIAEEAERCAMFYVNHRWLGGTLTNWGTIKKSINRFKELEGMEQDGRLERLPKKEARRIRRELAHLRENLSGIKELPGLPDALFVIDAGREIIAVREARKLGISVVAVVDTDCDPEEVDHVIPGNDDALRSIRLFVSKIAEAVLAGRALYEQAQLAAAKAEAGEAAEAVGAGEPVELGEGVGLAEEVAEEFESVVEAHDPDEVLPPHLRPRPMPTEAEAAEAKAAEGEAAEAKAAEGEAAEGERAGLPGEAGKSKAGAPETSATEAGGSESGEEGQGERSES